MKSSKRKEEENLSEEIISKVTEIEDPVSGISAQIEKLVFHKRYHEALDFFELLECEVDCQLDSSTCIGVRSIRGIKRVHNHMVTSALVLDQYLWNRILLMHIKCRMISYARSIFDDMPERNSVSWNTMVGGLLDFGDYLEAFRGYVIETTALVDFYIKWERIENACNVFEGMPQKNVTSWNALIGGYDDGWEIFESMSRDYKVKPRAMHYVCMIELLGREGFLDEAFALIRDAPFRPTINMWAALLTACRVHKNFELGKFAAEKLYGMEPEKRINYVMLLNIYNSAGKQDEAAAVIQTLKRKGLGIKSACTWIEIKKLPHVFLSGDKCHVQTKEIYEKVDELMLEISKYGYVTEGETLLPDVDEQEQKLPHYHSEKLAISFGLISTSSSTPLQLVQSHRVCNDCHNAIKLIAMITKREIVVRDASRFHRFKNHTCSCGDYW
ncbi:hypothetical protein BC332_17548 [Capsicum chinense]|nr:hypothetical protein BC332_17548 [Capsicum chinense]